MNMTRNGNGNGNGNHSGTSQTLAAYQAYQETMRHFLSLQERVMAQVLGHPIAADGAGDRLPLAPPPSMLAQMTGARETDAPARELAAAATVAVAMAEPIPIVEAPAAAAPELAVTRQQLTDRVLALIGERTGYPVEMLGPEQDLEAELGVDSIKRMEIVDSLRRQLPAALRDEADKHVEDLVRLNTVAGWVTTILSWNTNGTGASSTSVKIEPPQPIASPQADCPRWVMQAHEEELSDGTGTVPDGLFLITEDRLGVAAKLADALRSYDVPVAVLAQDTLGSFEAVERQVRDLIQQHGPVQGLVHLAALNTADGTNTLDLWRHRTQTEVKSLFELLRLTAPGLQARTGNGGACVLGATVLGGTWGRTNGGGLGSPASGGIYGLVKTLSTEYPGVSARVVDFDASLEADQIADRLRRELLSRSGGFEIGYPSGKRTVFTAKATPLTPNGTSVDLMPKPGWIVLITGGARGITAEIATRLAVPGVRLIVVGRTPHPGDEDPRLAGVAETAALRRYFLDQAKAAGDALTPAVIERKISTLAKEREIRRNLATLEERGAEVEYIAADVRDPVSLGAIVESVYGRYGAIHAVLHGAGVIEDKLLADKSRESFERVFDTKADSTFMLSRALRPEHLRWVVLMSSISGRIGNRGQVDYAAANEVMNRLAWDMARKLPSTRVLSINWGPWRGAGMTTDSVLPQLEARGIRAIEPDAGWRFLHDELTTGAHDVVEVIAGDGV